MHLQIPVPAPIPAPFTPANLQAWADAQHAEYERLSIEFPSGTIHEGRNDARYASEIASGCSQWMAEQGIAQAMVVGPFVGFDLPKKGSRIRVKKGAVMRSTSPKVPQEGEVLQRDRIVTVRMLDAGLFDTNAFRHRNTRDTVIRHANVTWAGSGGYWCWTDLSNVEVGVPQDAEANDGK